MVTDPKSAADAIDLLRRLGANPWLVRHHQLVVEAATELVDGLAKAFSLKVDRNFILVGAALHDVGKIAVPTEMSQPGHQHETEGGRLLEAHGVGPLLRRVCTGHADWAAPGLPLEHLLIALADKLWKGKREEDLEMLVIERLADSIGGEVAAVFANADAIFEAVSAGGDDRLARSSRS
jgi:hypothetical protein